MKSGLLSSWNHLLDEIPAHRRDIYFREEYVRLYEDASCRAVCFMYRDDDGLYLFPFLERNFEMRGMDCFDFETAYGYGGPVASTDAPSFIGRAWDAFMAMARARGYVAGFVRFHPLLNNGQLCGRDMVVIPERSTVAMSLDGTGQDIWMREIHTKNRNVIKKAIHNGLSFCADYEYRYYADFQRLYSATMDKLDASGFYYFNPAYFEGIRSGISNSFLGHVCKDGRIVASAIFMYDGEFGHYHLSGSDTQSLALNPNNLLLWGAALELKSHGVRQFHLGGGTDGRPDNSLLAFKRKFSNSLRQFSIGKLIVDDRLYCQACHDWEISNPYKIDTFGKLLLKYKY